MRRRMSIFSAIVLLVLLLSGCGGTKDADAVVSDLGKKVGNMKGYAAEGTMTIKTGDQPLQYSVNVSYLKPNFYRIELANTERDISQVILRNDEGVFVLTPRLNKVFKFKSDWPQNQGQVYLYQSLVQSIVNDQTRQFAQEKNSYVFDVLANYQNGSLSRQKIWINKKDYRPTQVQITDQNATVMVEVKFTKFDFKSNFDKNLFATDANLKQNNAGQSKDDSAEQPTSAPMFTPMEPSYLPEGVALKDAQDIKFGGASGTLMRYGGTYDFTLIETQPHDVATTFVKGTMVDLGFTLAELTGAEEGGQRTLTWTYQGIQHRLTSGTLPEAEMLRVAQSVLGEMTK